MKNYTNVIALVTTILLLIGFVGPAKAAPEPQEPTRVEVPVSAPLASLNYTKVKVSTTPAPVRVPTQPTVSPQSATKAPVAASTTAPVTSVPRASVVAPVPTVAVSSGGTALLSAARAQIGQTQDCTAMVERALGSIGIVTGDLAPAQFFRFGSVVATPAAGDIIISAGHVGIYSGNGMMVSGGFNGNQTVEHPISYISGYSAVRVA